MTEAESWNDVSFRSYVSTFAWNPSTSLYAHYRDGKRSTFTCLFKCTNVLFSFSIAFAFCAVRMKDTNTAPNLRKDIENRTPSHNIHLRMPSAPFHMCLSLTSLVHSQPTAAEYASLFSFICSISASTRSAMMICNSSSSHGCRSKSLRSIECIHTFRKSHSSP